MTDQTIQIALSVGVPTIAVLVGVLINNSHLGDLRSHMDSQFAAVNQRFDDVSRRFDDVNRRFDDAKDVWRAELHRVEEVIDARMKHLERR
jgi:hypothetical protein